MLNGKVMYMQANLKMVINMENEYINGIMVMFKMENGKKGIGMDGEL